MQNLAPKCRQISIAVYISQKPGYLSEKLKTDKF